MKAERKRVVLIVMVLSILLAVAGQYYFAKKRAFMWDGIFLYLVAMVLFGWVGTRIETSPDRKERASSSVWYEIWRALRFSTIRLVILLVGLALIVYVTTAAGSRFPGKPFWDLLALWALSIALAVGAFVDWTGLPQGLRGAWQKLRRHGPESVLVLVLALATFLFRGTNLSGIPFVLSGDEASMGLEAIGVIEGRRSSPFVTGWLSHPTLYFFLQAAFLRVFGVTTAALRLPSALMSSATVVLLYLFARRYYGRWIAVLAAVFFAAYHYAIHFGRLAINNIWDPFFALGVLYYVSRGLEERRLGDLLVGGLLLGVAAYFYMGARLIPIMLVVYFAYWAWRQRGFLRDNLAYLIIVVLIAFIVALPILSFFRTHPRDLMARWGLLGIFPSGWVKAEMQRTGKSTASIVFGQFVKAGLAFNYYPDPTFWYRPGIPLLRFGTSIFFVFGLAYCVRHWRKKEYLLLVLWYLLVVIFGGALMENPPTSPRLVLAIPPVVLCVALGLAKISSYIQSVLKRQRGLAVAVSLILTLFLSYQSARFYFAEYTPSHAFGGTNTEVADRMGKYLRALGPSYQCYFFGPPRMYYGFATIPFIARDTVGVDVHEPITNVTGLVNPDRKAVFVFLPERRSELDTVRRFYPTGRLREFRNYKGHILFVAYETDT